MVWWWWWGVVVVGVLLLGLLGLFCWVGREQQQQRRTTTPHLAVLADHAARGADHHDRVPDRVPVRRVALEDGRQHHHRVFFSQRPAERRGAAVLGRLCKLAPRALARAEGERHGPRLLQAQDVAPGLARGRGQALDARQGRRALRGVRGGRRQRAGVLDAADAHDARRPALLGRGVLGEGVEAQVKGLVGRRVGVGGAGGGAGWAGGVVAAAVGARDAAVGCSVAVGECAARGRRLELGRGGPVQHAHRGAQLARGQVRGEEVLEPVVAGDGAVVSVRHVERDLGGARA